MPAVAKLEERVASGSQQRASGCTTIIALAEFQKAQAVERGSLRVEAIIVVYRVGRKPYRGAERQIGAV